MNRYIQAAAVCGACLAIAAAAHAGDPIQTVTITDGTFDDGGTFSGTFSAEFFTTNYTWDITTTAGSTLSGAEYSSSGTGYNTFSPNGGALEFSAGSPSGTTLELIPSDPAAYSGTIMGSESAYTGTTSGTPSRTITGGNYVITISGVPEPAAWAMMLVGTAFAGATLRRRRPAALAG